MQPNHQLHTHLPPSEMCFIAGNTSCKEVLLTLLSQFQPISSIPHFQNIALNLWLKKYLPHRFPVLCPPMLLILIAGCSLRKNPSALIITGKLFHDAIRIFCQIYTTLFHFLIRKFSDVRKIRMF